MSDDMTNRWAAAVLVGAVAAPVVIPAALLAVAYLIGRRS